jgi:hypothetical protein
VQIHHCQRGSINPRVLHQGRNHNSITRMTTILMALLLPLADQLSKTFSPPERLLWAISLPAAGANYSGNTRAPACPGRRPCHLVSKVAAASRRCNGSGMQFVLVAEWRSSSASNIENGQNYSLKPATAIRSAIARQTQISLACP